MRLQNRLNKKGEGSGPLAIVILILFFVANWFLWLGKFVGQTSQTAISNNNLTGIEAWGYGSMNLYIFIGLILGTMAYLYFSQ